MSNYFVNAPIQNGNFALDTHPHKLVSMRVAESLNHIVGNQPAPHAWNLARLSGDNEYREYSKQRNALSRIQFELGRITSRYAESHSYESEPSYITDIDDNSVDIGRQLVEEGLSNGKLTIEEDLVDTCACCGHFAGNSKCNACGAEKILREKRKRLFSHRDNSSSVVTPSDTYGNIKVSYIDAMTRHNQNPLPLSTTRDLGISLEPFGLSSQVLDPRAGLHVAILSAADQLPDTSTVTMLTTASVAIKSMAHGQHFRKYNNTRLIYGLHGRIPYAEMADDKPANGSEELEDEFRKWFLPLQSLNSREPIPHEQIPRLRKFFARIACASIGRPPGPDLVKGQVESGSFRWISDKRLLANAWQNHIDLTHQ